MNFELYKCMTICLKDINSLASFICLNLWHEVGCVLFCVEQLVSFQKHFDENDLDLEKSFQPLNHKNILNFEKKMCFEIKFFNKKIRNLQIINRLFEVFKSSNRLWSANCFVSVSTRTNKHSGISTKGRVQLKGSCSNKTFFKNYLKHTNQGRG